MNVRQDKLDNLVVDKIAEYIFKNENISALTEKLRELDLKPNVEHTNSIKRIGIPAIISDETYNKAMQIMDNHKRSPAQNCAKHIYLLSGLVKCGHCGEIMHGNTHTNVKGSVFHSYRCEKKHNKDCPKHIIREFVDSVLVYSSRIEVIVKISSNIIAGCPYTITKAINRQFLPNPHKRTAD